MLPYYWNVSVGAFHSSSLGGREQMVKIQTRPNYQLPLNVREEFIPSPKSHYHCRYNKIDWNSIISIYICQPGLDCKSSICYDEDMRRARDMRVQWLLSDHGQLCGLWLTMTLETLSRAERDHLKVVSILLQKLHDIGSYALEQTEFRQLNLESRNGLKY